MDNTRSAIGGQNQNQQAGDPNVNYNTSPVSIGNQLSDGDQFIVLTKSRQSDEFKVWTSAHDQQEFETLYRQGATQVAGLATT